MKLVVIDDEPDVVDLIRYYFQQKGVEVITYTDSVKAKGEMCRINPDVIITDWMMPELNGKELLKSIKDDNKISTTPVIMLSCISDFSSISNLFRIGLDDYVMKPVNMKKLYDIVIDHYNSSKARLN